MNTFIYSALTKDNTYVKGQVNALTRKNALAKLESEGLLVINAKKETSKYFEKLLSIGTISRKDKIYFTRHLHAFIDAGIALDEALKIAAEQIVNRKFKEVLYNTYNNVVGGQPLYASLEQYPKYFSGYFRKMIRVGEETGRLDEILKHLLEQQEKEHELLTKIRGAMIYPAVIVFTAILVLVFLMTFVVPTVATVLTSYGGELPLATKILIATSNFLVNYGLYLIVPIVLFIIALRFLVRTKKGKWYFEKLLLNLPVIKKVVIEYNIARFTRSMSAPLLSGLSIDKSLELAAETCENFHYKQTIEECIKFVHKGIPLSEVLIGHPKLYAPQVTRMIEIGEKTGKFDDMFDRLADFYEKSVFHTFGNLSSIIEPFLIIFIGLVVGFVAVSILTPIWKFAETI